MILAQEMMQATSAAQRNLVDLPGLPAALWPALAQAAGTDRVALVGGAVRDLLLHREHRDPWRGLLDLDLVVEGPAERFVQRLGQVPGVELHAVRAHGSYGTVELQLGLQGTELLLDVATARAEHYPIAAGKPVVSAAPLEADLARRDFSINAIAMVLAGGDAAPHLLDPHGGRQDLVSRELRFLHDASFRDDPSRLVRAARYAARLQFRLAEAAQQQVTRTLEQWPWPLSDVSAAPPALASRLRMEFALLLEREPWVQALRLLQSWGGLVLLDDGLQADPHWCRRLCWSARFGLDPLVALLAGCRDPVAVAQRLQLPHREVHYLAAAVQLRQRLLPLQCRPQSPSQWTALLEGEGSSAEAVALCLISGWGPRRPLLRWWCRWRHVRSPRSARELMEQEGISAGPQLGERLRQLRALALDQLPA